MEFTLDSENIQIKINEVKNRCNSNNFISDEHNFSDSELNDSSNLIN